MLRLSTRRKMVIVGCVLIALAAGLACNDQPRVELAETGDVGVVEGEGGEVGGGGEGRGSSPPTEPAAWTEQEMCGTAT